MSIGEIKKRAWDSLRTNYWMLFVAVLIVGLISGLLNIFAILVIGPLSVGLSLVYLDNARTENVDVGVLFSPFSTSFINSLAAVLLKSVFIFLWSLLFIIPGIIKSYSYSLVEYLIADNPELDSMEAIKKSSELMYGNKMKLFLLDLSFIGWYILGILTFGIGLIFLTPYIKAARTEFYLDLIGESRNIKVEKSEIDEDDYTIEW